MESNRSSTSSLNGTSPSKNGGNGSQRNGAKPSRKAKSSGPYTDAQTIDIGIYESSLRTGTGWRRATFGVLVLCFLLVVVSLVLATKDHTEAVVYKEDRNGDIALIGLSSHNRSPADASVKAQLTAWITAVRNIPGDDNALIENNATLVLYMVSKGSQAYNDYVKFIHDDNPRDLGRKGYKRTVPVGGVEIDKLTDITYRIAWKEILAQGNDDTPKLNTYTGTVTLAQLPQVPADALIGQYNPAGVYIQSYDMGWSILR